MIYRIMGFLLLIETAMLMCCGGVSLFYKEDDLNSFLLSSAITAFVGVIMLAIGRGAEKSLNRRDGYVIVSVAWIAFSKGRYAESGHIAAGITICHIVRPPVGGNQIRQAVIKTDGNDKGHPIPI